MRPGGPSNVERDLLEWRLATGIDDRGQSLNRVFEPWTRQRKHQVDTGHVAPEDWPHLAPDPTACLDQGGLFAWEPSRHEIRKTQLVDAIT